MPPSQDLVLGAIEAAMASGGLRPTSESPMAVAYSGGLDSTVLLHGLNALHIPVKPVHVNHQLQPVAIQWESHCTDFCESLGQPLDILRVDVKLGRQGAEGQARKARYKAIQTWMRSHNLTFLACGHHQDDQFETVLLQLFRGSGLRGLAGMRTLGPTGVDASLFPEIVVFRPLLTLSKRTLADYATAHGLSHVEDPSNANDVYKRNWIRGRLLPELQSHFPQASSGILKMSAHFQGYFAELDQQNKVSLDEVCQSGVIDLKTWNALPQTRRVEVLRAWLRQGGVLCNRAQLLELQRQLGLPQGGRRQVCNGWYIQVLRHKARLIIES
ncbi:MAG TPA: tRNA lysidine(34) synthetase TilS [Limnobacter sp.]|uniref:tRNA lysidine(34) synthetase TilS n=1 Tax=Limnobacter sp. TaxID=2003368 RepID=UPI002E3444CA|nr:tRNA lysidine(34) synthetase TilS [Limnobacter sp.]HEX5487360.1 tRNA lysidine(34) synthetase TilS [Limnobacter sp.]